MALSRSYHSGVLVVLALFLSLCCGCGSEPKSESLSETKANPGQSDVPDGIPVSTTRPEIGQTLSELYQKSGPAVFTILATSDQGLVQGSGFFISQDGIAISNYHVLEGVYLDQAEIRMEDGSQVRIKEILARNSVEDYIVFKVVLDHQDFPSLPLAPQEAEIGEKVFAIGTPEGLEQTLSEGIISGYRDSRTIIQTTADIEPGSSGGPLLNMRGEVIGITTATLGEANLNFAVNVNLLHLIRFLN